MDTEINRSNEYRGLRVTLPGVHKYELYQIFSLKWVNGENTPSHPPWVQLCQPRVANCHTAYAFQIRKHGSAKDNLPTVSIERLLFPQTIMN